MPKGNRGNHGKPAALRLAVRVVSVPKGTTPRAIREVLLRSIARKDYRLPPQWEVEINWSNHANQPLRSDEWTNAMVDSAQSSRGWDSIVARYIERNIR